MFEGLRKKKDPAAKEAEFNAAWEEIDAVDEEHRQTLRDIDQLNLLIDRGDPANAEDRKAIVEALDSIRERARPFSNDPTTDQEKDVVAGLNAAIKAAWDFEMWDEEHKS